MKLGLIRTTIALALCTLMGGAALANVKSKNVRLDDEVSVAGTVLKKGTYKVSFDDQTNELTIKRNGKLVVKTNAQLEAHKNTGSVAPDYKTRTGDAGSAAMLTSINLGGAYAVIGNSGGAATAGAQQ